MNDDLTPEWTPAPDALDHANIGWAIRETGVADYPALHRWSITNRADYWRLAINRLGIAFHTPYSAIATDLNTTCSRWLPDALLNIVESCFQAPPESAAIVSSGASGDLQTLTVAELRSLTSRVANSLVQAGGMPGDRIGVILPMTPTAIAVYLGVIAAGMAVVCIPDSFAADEIATRLRVGDASLVITQDYVRRGGKALALYERIVAAQGPKAIVIACGAGEPVTLRDGDTAWDSWLSSDEFFSPVPGNPDDTISILFSSGTTGDPKAIPWDHTTPIKSAADGHFHLDTRPGDTVCWPTSLGWMMGPWLVFASLINRATIALYEDSPLEAGFGRFVQNTHVTMLGIVPSIVRVWRASGCMQQFDWTSIRNFGSTGECSNATDMRYLMHLAGNKPVIEYCGGTETGGSYITGTVVQPCIPATFSTPALGIDFDLRDENGEQARTGEAFLVGPSMGLSNRLLNRDHEAVYYDDCPPGSSGIPLRRHGDEIETLANGYFRMIGRSDDTMNLGGIKVGCAEIERVVCQLDGVQEAAAIAAPSEGGGPSRLVLYVVPASNTPPGDLRLAMQKAIRTHLNPLFHIDSVVTVQSLPRTASNKVMRRELRKQFMQPPDSPTKA
ncbi:MAG TPA: AMP-binding protein [Capsulimonadaceae bacterium]|jgi:acetyl-CoA synthetase